MGKKVKKEANQLVLEQMRKKGYTVRKLAIESGLARHTIDKMRAGEPVLDTKAWMLADKLGTTLEKLKIKTL